MHRYRVSFWRTRDASLHGDAPTAVFTDVPGWSRHDAKTNVDSRYEEQYGPWWDAEKTYHHPDPREDGMHMTYEEWAAAKSTRPLLAFAKAALKPKVYRRRLRLAACRVGMDLWDGDEERLTLCWVGIDRAYGRTTAETKSVTESAFFKKRAERGFVCGQDSVAVRLARNGANAFFEGVVGGKIVAWQYHGQHTTTFRDVCPYPKDDLDVEHDWLVWQDGLVQKLAEVIVEEEKWDETYALADALEEAGCQHEHLIAHLREKKGHNIACWGIDLLLGRL